MDSQTDSAEKTAPAASASPTWSQNTKLLVTSALLLGFLVIVYLMRDFLLWLVLSMVVGYVLEPVVDFVHKRTHLSRTLSIVLVYLIIIAGLIAIPVTTIPPLIEQVTNFVNNLPRFIEQFGVFLATPIELADFTFTPLEQLPLDQILNNIIGIIQSAGTQTISLLGVITSTTFSTISWVAFVLFVSFYVVKDDRDLYRGLVAIFPDNYQDDLRHLGNEIDIVWNAFLRGQVLLSLTVGTVVFCVAWIIGLPSPLVLGLIAGLLEVVPYLGPVLSAIPAVLLAYFQTNASWLGSLMTPLWFVLIVAVLYWVVQQLENYWLVPRIMGRHLKMHPAVVFIAALAGASIAGILGVFLASPLLATLRIFSRYIYNKLTDRPPFSEPDESELDDVAAEKADEKSAESSPTPKLNALWSSIRRKIPQLREET